MSSTFITRETHLLALCRALAPLDTPSLDGMLDRARAYAAAGFTAWSGADDAEALRRTRFYRAYIARPARVSQMAVAA